MEKCSKLSGLATWTDSLTGEKTRAWALVVLMALIMFHLISPLSALQSVSCGGYMSSFQFTRNNLTIEVQLSNVMARTTYVRNNKLPPHPFQEATEEDLEDASANYQLPVGRTPISVPCSVRPPGAQCPTHSFLYAKTYTPTVVSMNALDSNMTLLLHCTTDVCRLLS
ncbi:hypothetical protein F4780DRAFT_241426 [Xylariomycetidae sp. FL0641]|nr:hypothetical protein F4780DRAFT_241426 [Xylariomycetidae sp. FL0641]